MAVQWLNVDKATREIRGWQRSSKADNPPPDTPAIERVVMTQAQFDEYNTQLAAIRNAGRSRPVKLVDGSLVVDADTRIAAAVTADRTVVDISNGESVTLTFTTSRPANYTGTVDLETSERILRLRFTGGTAQKTLTPTRSGRLGIRSTDQVKIAEPLRILIVE